MSPLHRQKIVNWSAAGVILTAITLAATSLAFVVRADTKAEAAGIKAEAVRVKAETDHDLLLEIRGDVKMTRELLERHEKETRRQPSGGVAATP